MTIATTTEAILGYITAVLGALEQQDADLQRRMAALEAEGFRLVDGGADGDGRWSVDDYRTGALLASGNGGIEEYQAACQHDWYHIDRLRTEIDLIDPDPPEQLPTSLCHTLIEWVLEHREDARRLVANL